MSLRIRHLKISLATNIGPFGVEVGFEDGLNVLAAPNTSGKSTCVMSILYALGLEGMLGPSQNPPLPDAMWKRVMHEDREYDVLESRVRLQVENHRKESLTVERLVTGTVANRQLIRAVLGPDLTAPSDAYQRRDFFVRTSGGMQSDSGFHRYLAEFIGYSLPNVPGVDKEPVPLYLECIFPYFFVDQLTGWRDIKARMPTYLRIPEMAKRTGEFVLDLDILHRAIERQELILKEAELKEKWKKAQEQARAELIRAQVIVRGIPDEPTAIWPPPTAPQLFATEGENWIPLREAVQRFAERRDRIVTEDIPRAEEVSATVIAQLRDTEEQLTRFTGRLESLTKEVMSERAHREAVYKRLRALNEDYRKYQDAKRLQDRGGEVSLETAKGLCPTCHQPLKDTLLPQTKAQNPMSLEDNIAFIRGQLETFGAMLNDADDVIETKESQVEAVLERIKDLNAQIRAQKKTLKSGGQVPSVAAVQERLEVEARLLSLEASTKQFETILERFKELSREWADLVARMKRVADLNLSVADERKLKRLEDSFVAQLREYNFTSFPVDQIGIGRESYRPSRGGYDVGLTSASDTIRIIWAYLLGMLELARVEKTNHLGLVIFDEPRQHGAEKPSFEALLKRASESGNVGQQVIFTTSEERALLESIVSGIECKYERFDGKVLRPISSKAKDGAVSEVSPPASDTQISGQADVSVLPPETTEEAEQDEEQE